MHQSIATIDSPEFINLQPLEINPLMSSCEIKVMYLGENRNHSFITKEVATEMAKTLRGAPIVGYYKEEKEDFADHGERIIFDDEGMKTLCMTVPYGFVAPNAEVWFQKFEDTDEFGNKTTREYLMTTGYLWTGQYEECKSVIENGKPQSMELDEESLEGHWSTNSNTGMDFFIINDAIFSKLCILGDDVEPCFEGSRITANEVSKTFSKIDDNFKNTLYTMMQDLKFALEGGNKMEEELIQTTPEVAEEEVVAETEEISEEVVNEVISEEVESEPTEEVKEEAAETEFTAEEEVAEAPAVEEEIAEDNVEEEIVVEEEEISTEEVNEEQSILAETEDSIEAQSSQENFAKADDKEEEESDDSEDSEDADKEKEEEDKKDYSLLYSELQAAYSDLESKYQALVEFKSQVEDKEKDSLIDSFYMLSDEDKAEVIANKSTYSLEEIESKLSVICVRKKVNFDLDETSKEDKVEEVTTYALGSEGESTVLPAWLGAVKSHRDSIK